MSTPECSILKRHYLTEIQSTQKANFDAMIMDTRRPRVVKHEVVIEEKNSIIYIVAFIFVLALFFI